MEPREPTEYKHDASGITDDQVMLEMWLRHRNELAREIMVRYYQTRIAMAKKESSGDR